MSARHGFGGSESCYFWVIISWVFHIISYKDLPFTSFIVIFQWVLLSAINTLILKLLFTLFKDTEENQADEEKYHKVCLLKSSEKHIRNYKHNGYSKIVKLRTVFHRWALLDLLLLMRELGWTINFLRIGRI